MPLKDISKEEQSNLFLAGFSYKEPVKITLADKLNFGGKLPLSYYNLINDEISRREDGGRDNYGLIPGVNQDVPNPNVLNRPLAWPIKIKTSVCSGDLDEVIEVVIMALEKFHWENSDISFWVKKELDQRFGCSWHVVAGEEFGFDITYEVGNMVYIFYGSLGILLCNRTFSVDINIDN